MTRGEVLAALSQLIKDLWDDRAWSLSLLSKDPVETYNEGVKRQQSVEDADKIEDLPEQHQEWLRATKSG